MSVFGTTAAFALVGSTGKSFERGSEPMINGISGLVHMAIFSWDPFMGVGKKAWLSYPDPILSCPFWSDGLGYCFFLYLCCWWFPTAVGIIGAGKVIEPVTAGAFPDLYPSHHNGLGWRCSCG